MSHARLLYLLLPFLCGFHGVEGKSGVNPCHTRAIKTASSDCEVITLPPGFCGACTIGQFGDEKGEFVDCEKTMDVETDPMCLSLYESYVKLNPCDEVRAQAVQEFKSSNENTKETGRLKLDYFGYAICEQGCDCIPQVDAMRENRVLDVYRGNCQAHAYHDICTTLPDVKLIRLNGTAHDITESPRFCDLINEWMDSSAADNWGSNPKTTVHDDVKSFFERMAEALQLVEDESYWNACYDLELTQGRIEEITGPPTIGPPIATPSLPPTPADTVILGLEVWNTNGKKIQDLVDGDTVELTDNDLSITILAIASSVPAKVRFDLDGSYSRTEKNEPFALFGDSGGIYKEWRQPIGNHTMTVTPISAAGTDGASITIYFTVETVY